MSGFQIPGLGHAKPDEKLPPLSPDQTVGAPIPDAEADTSRDVEIPDAADVPLESQRSQSQQTNGEAPQESQQTAQTGASKAEPAHNQNGDAMVLDREASPPSITGALEAALGLEPEVPVVVDAEAALAQNNPTMLEAQTQPAATNGASEQPEWEADSSPYESSSSETTSDDSSDADSDNEGYELLGVEETARMLMEQEGGSDDEGGDKAGKPSTASQLRTKNELPAERIPKPDVTITPETKVDELGAVEHIVENMVLIKAFTPGEYQVLDTGSVLLNESRTVIGAVAETIGKVLQPMYIVHFDSAEDIAAHDVTVGSKILYPVEHAKFIFTEPLKNLKGSDASNIHDEEVGDDEMEFSDDEKEAEYKRAKKELKRKKHGGDRGGKGPHPLRQVEGPAELNYDDIGEYTPLTRPAGFGGGPTSVEADPSPKGGFKGRGRGDRARGGRGRGSNRGGRGGASRDGYSAPPQSDHQQQYPPQQQQVPPPPPNWNPQGQAPAPSFPNFGFQMPGWPQQPPAQGNAVPPPPPGWPAATQGQQQQQQGGSNGAFMNPAVMAALMQHMQGQQGGQQQPWQPPPPPGSGH